MPKRYRGIVAQRKKQAHQEKCQKNRSLYRRSLVRHSDWGCCCFYLAATVQRRSTQNAARARKKRRIAQADTTSPRLSPVPFGLHLLSTVAESTISQNITALPMPAALEPRIGSVCFAAFFLNHCHVDVVVEEKCSLPPVMFGARAGLLTDAQLADIRYVDSEMKDLHQYWTKDAFQRKFVSAKHFSYADMVSALRDSVPYVASNVRVSFLPARASDGDGIPLPPVDHLVAEILRSGRMLRSVEYKNGGKRSRFLRLPLLLDQWRQSATTMLSPDKLENIITGSLGNFASRIFLHEVDDTNAFKDSAKELRGLTLSPRGALSLTHSDDFNGIVFYASGMKLWFFMDKLEAAKAGDGIPDFYNGKLPATVNKAAFSLSQFASMQRSWWTVAGAKELLAVPADMLHRVVTIEPTMGVTFNYKSSPRKKE